MRTAEREGQVQWALEICRSQGLRHTHSLARILQELVKKDNPVNLSELNKVLQAEAECDPATTYRCLIKLERIGVVRRLGLHDRAAYYVLLTPGSHHDYLICTDCGSIDRIDMECPVHALEESLQKKSGFRKLYHELEFYGQCPKCQRDV